MNRLYKLIIGISTALMKKVGLKLLKTKPNNKDLLFIIEHIEHLRSAAWRKLINRQPTKKELKRIIKKIPSLRSMATSILLRRECLTNKDFDFIGKYTVGI